MFIKIYNSFITGKSKNKLTENELFIYCYLYTLRTYENSVLTSYNLLSVENKLYKNQSDNKKEIKSCINSLREKQLIKIEEKNKLLTITFSFQEKGHVQTTYDKFRSFTKPRDLYVYVAVSKWEQKGGAKYSNNDWAGLLDITREYAIEVIADACERGIIYKKVGTYTGNLIDGRNQKVQEKNTYSIKPFINEKSKVDNGESKAEFRLVEEIPTTSNFDLDFEEELHNWNNTNDLTVDDFVYYLKNLNDKEIKEMCEKKINRILFKNNKFKFVMEKYVKEAEEIITSDKRKNKEKEENLFNETIKEMIRQIDDIVLQINNELVPYQEYSGQGNDIEKVYYFEKEDISAEVGEEGALIYNLRVKEKPRCIDIYRKKDGQWREWFSIENELNSCEGV
ncbi:hypothetical protein [Bacillus mycoides]|uniref:hypothetical protein n=1 Tax=Bacillus mycoides TaxID=1405 RepID=UPI001C032CE7|nr:hypothetical protein [Bacillus mycoides]QWI10072.1 hypothetical protein EXW47_06505 [Bacillus mycoides]